MEVPLICVPRSQTIDPIALQFQEFSHRSDPMPTVWAIVNLQNVDKHWQQEYGVRRLWQWFGTDHRIPQGLCRSQHIGTLQDENLVFHLFDVGRAPREAL